MPRQKKLLRVLLLVSFSFLLSPFSFLPHASALATASVSQPTVSNGLVLHYTFDGKDMTLTTVTDKSVSGYTGTITNTSATTSATLGTVGQGFRFDGTDDYVDAGVINPLPAGVGTVSLWVNMRTASIGQNNYVFARGNDDVGNQNIGLTINPSSATNAAIYLLYGSARWASTTNQMILTNKWNHIAVVMKSNNTQEFYINGVLVGTDIKSTITPTAGLSLYVGKQVRANPNGYHSAASIDDFRLYNRALSASEVASLAGIKGKPVTTSNSGLIGYWPFDANTVESTVLKDNSGRGNNASLIASPSKVQGKVRDAYSFDGSTQYAQVTASSDLNLTSNATLAAWVKVSTLKNYNQVVMRNRDNIDFYGMVIDSTGGVFAQFANNSSVCAPLSTTKIEAGRWYHLVVTYDGSLGSANCKIYINAVQDATTATYSGGIGTGFTTEVLAIGMDPANASRVFSGSIDEVKVYNRTLSPSEITTLYKSGATTGSYGAIATSSILISNGLVGYWTFDGKTMTSSTSTDSSGAANHGALASSPPVVLGKVGQGISLNGSNQYINAGRNTSLNFTGNMTVAFWIKPSASQVSLANIINKHGSGNAGFTLQQNSASTNAYAFAWGNGSGYTCDSTTLFTATANVWQHVVVVKSGTLVTAYVNGVQSGTCTGSFSTIATNSDNVNIGRWTSGAARHWAGSLDDMRLYNRALSAIEIQVLYKSGGR